MAEPEEIIIDAARHATVFVSRLWSRPNQGQDNACTLAAHKQRLELLLAAVHGYDIRVNVAQEPAPESALSRLFRNRPRHMVEPRALPANDGAQIFLPAQLASAAPLQLPLQLFRILALQQAGRAQRRVVFGDAMPSALAEDLFYLSEALAVDHMLALDFPGFTHDLLALRHAMLSERLQPALLNAPERVIEDFYCRALNAHPALIPSPYITAAAANDSLTWAIETAREISAMCDSGKIRYRGMRSDLWLGRTLPVAAAHQKQLDAANTPDAPAQTPRTARLSRRPEIRKKNEDEDDAVQGMWMLQMDDPQQHVEDPAGMQRPTDRDDNADAGDIADSLSELPEACLISNPKPALEVLLSDDSPAQRAVLPPGLAAAGAGISYPEWDFRIPGYGERGAVVRLQASPLGDPAWVESVLAKRYGLLQQVRRRFEGMRPRRTRQNRQADGHDLDISAYVNAFAEQHMGLPLEDRLYQSVRPARRDIAIALLIDISGSTDGWVSGDLRIIDVEKEALLLVNYALMALSDPFCILAFSGESAQNVTLWPVKNFDESDNNLIHRRIAGLEPQRYTRAGAAIRHTTSLLVARPALHRLLILLSDGKPNDVDLYEGPYGVEDMRRAVAEATLQSVHPFCLTVDRHAPQYLAGIFGPGHYAVLQHPQFLPVVLADILKKLVKT